MRSFVVVMTMFVCALAVLIGGAGSASADTVAQPLPFSQNWTNIGLVTTDDN